MAAKPRRPTPRATLGPELKLNGLVVKGEGETASNWETATAEQLEGALMN